MSAVSTSTGGSPSGGSSRNSGGHQARPSAAKTAASSGASGSGSSGATKAGAPVARSNAVPNRSGSAATSSTGTPSSVNPTARRSSCSIIATICGSAANRASTADGSVDGTHDREPLARVAPPPHVAGHLAAEELRDPADELPRLVEQQPALRPRLGLARERLEDPRLVLRADPGHGPQPAGGRGGAELLGGADAERAGDVDRPPGAEPEIAPEPHQARGEVALQLGELGDLPGLDQLAQPRLDPGPDPPQLTHPAGADELRERDRRVADRLGGAAVGARRVGVRIGELEQRGEGLQAVGDPGVVHRGDQDRETKFTRRPSAKARRKSASEYGPSPARS